MKDISTMNFGEALQTVRKSSKELGSRIKLAAKAGVDSRKISSIEKGESLPTKKQLNALCDALGNEQLREKGLSEIEYKRTHLDVKICFLKVLQYRLMGLVKKCSKSLRQRVLCLKNVKAVSQASRIL